MSCDIDGFTDFHRATERTARKPRRCGACRERICAGQAYVDHAWKYDGDFQTLAHCERCSALFKHLLAHADDGVDIMLDCGHTYEEVHGELPDHIAALAFWLPGEPIPEPKARARNPADGHDS